MSAARAPLVARTLAWAADYYPGRQQPPPADLGGISLDEVLELFHSCPSRLAHLALVDQASIRFWVNRKDVAAKVKQAWDRYAPEQPQQPLPPLPLFEAPQSASKTPRKPILIEAPPVPKDPRCHYCGSTRAWFGFGPPFRPDTVLTCRDCRHLAEQRT